MGHKFKSAILIGAFYFDGSSFAHSISYYFAEEKNPPHLISDVKCVHDDTHKENVLKKRHNYIVNKVFIRKLMIKTEFSARNSIGAIFSFAKTEFNCPIPHSLGYGSIP